MFILSQLTNCCTSCYLKSAPTASWTDLKPSLSKHSASSHYTKGKKMAIIIIYRFIFFPFFISGIPKATKCKKIIKNNNTALRLFSFFLKQYEPSASSYKEEHWNWEEKNTHDLSFEFSFHLIPKFSNVNLTLKFWIWFHLVLRFLNITILSLKFEFCSDLISKFKYHPFYLNFSLHPLSAISINVYYHDTWHTDINFYVISFQNFQSADVCKR